MEIKIELSAFIELITDAHMAGQHDAGCKHSSYGNARSYYAHEVEYKIKNLGERSEPPHPLLDDGWRLFEKSNMPNNGETVYLCLYRDNRTIEEPCPHQEFEYYVGINENDRDSINIGRFYIYKYDQYNLLFWKRIVPPSVI